METYNHLSDEQFRRLTGIKRPTFEKMLEVLREKEAEKNRRGARPNKLSLEERLLMWLEYLREYRTYFHSAKKRNVSESTCYRNCVWIEDVLIQSKVFRLPNRKVCLKNSDIEVVVVDASESPIQRPKKNNENITLGRKSGIRSKRRSSSTRRIVGF